MGKRDYRMQCSGPNCTKLASPAVPPGWLSIYLTEGREDGSTGFMTIFCSWDCLAGWAAVSNGIGRPARYDHDYTAARLSD